MNKSFLMSLGAIVLLLLSLPRLQAQSPRGFNYQAVARDAAGNLLANQNATVVLDIRQGGAAGALIYQETHNTSTNAYGLINLVVGKGTTIAGDFETIDWASDDYFLGVTLNGNPLGASELEAVPYSKVATEMGLSQLTDVTVAAPAAGEVLKWNGSAWAPAADEGTSYAAGAGLLLSGTTFSSTLGTAIETGEIANAAVTEPKLANNSVTSAKIANNAVTEPKLANNSVTSTKIANNAVITAKIANGAVTANKLGQSGANNGQVLKWNGSAWAPAADDGTSYAAGAGLLLSGTTFSATLGTAIETGEIANAAVTEPKLANNSVTSTKIANNAVITAKIANGAVTANKLDQSGATNGQVLKWNGTAWAPAADDGGAASQWTTTGNNIFYNTGNVGIGDATPAATLTVGNGDKFQVAGADGDVTFNDLQGTLRFPAVTAAGAAPMIHMFSGGTANADRMVIGHSPNFSTWGLEYKDTTDVFFLRNGSTRHFSFNLAQGRMGIGRGDDALTFPLEVAGRMRLHSTGSTVNRPGIWFANQANTFNRALFGMSEPDSAIGIFSQHMNKWVVEFELMREPRIGVNIPAGSPPRAEVHLYHTNFGGSNDGIRIQNEGPNAHYWNLYTSNTTGAFEFFKSGIKRATINPTSGAFTAVSDARLKTNISPLNKAVLPSVMNLQAKTYQYTDGPDKRFFMGFLAQELEPLFPEFVYHGGDDQVMYTVDYGGMSVVALKAIQEQQKAIETQQAVIETQQSQIQSLQGALQQFQQQTQSLQDALQQLQQQVNALMEAKE